jgi:Peptidase family M23
MFPLKNRILTRGCQAHINAGLPCAADYRANHTPFQIPFTGTVQTYHNKTGGNWLRLIRDDNGDKIELAHLSEYYIKSGHAQAGDLGGVTGNTGTWTTGPHLHIQIINKQGKYLDPEKYDWQTPMPLQLPISLITTQSWTLPQVQESILEVIKASDARLEPIVDIQQKAFPSIPFSEDRIDDIWYKDNILPLCSDLPMFHCAVSEWKATNQGYETVSGIHFRADENEQLHFSQSGITVKAFVQNFVHELCHRLFRITGQADVTHQFMNPTLGIWNPKGAYSQLDYSKLKTSNTMQLVNDKGTVFIVAGNKDKRKIGIADEETLGLFGDEPQVQMDTSHIPQYQTMRKGFVIDNK